MFDLSQENGVKGSKWKYKVYFEPEADVSAGRTYNISGYNLKAALEFLVNAGGYDKLRATLEFFVNAREYDKLRAVLKFLINAKKYSKLGAALEFLEYARNCDKLRAILEVLVDARECHKIRAKQKFLVDAGEYDKFSAELDVLVDAREYDKLRAAIKGLVDAEEYDKLRAIQDVLVDDREYDKLRATIEVFLDAGEYDKLRAILVLLVDDFDKLRAALEVLVEYDNSRAINQIYQYIRTENYNLTEEERVLLRDRRDRRFEAVLYNSEKNVQLRATLELLVYATEEILTVEAVKVPLSEWQLTKFVFYHMFIVLKTRDWWWSIEKNSKGITIQRSKQKRAVRDRYRQNARVSGMAQMKKDKAKGTVKALIDWLWKQDELNNKYNYITSNCQHFGGKVFNFVSVSETF